MKVTRRQFMQATAAAGLAASPGAVVGAASGKKYRTALLGSGWWVMNILREAMAADRSKVVAGSVAGIPLVRRRRGVGCPVVIEHGEQLTLVDRLADRHRNAADGSADVRHHLVLHLHRLEHDQRGPGEHRLVGPVGDRDHGPRKRRRQLGVARHARDDRGSAGRVDNGSR